LIIQELLFDCSQDGFLPEVIVKFSETGFNDGSEDIIEFSYTSFEDTLEVIKGHGISLGCSGPMVYTRPAIADEIVSKCKELRWTVEVQG
jgi:hypothetical protein